MRAAYSKLEFALKVNLTTEQRAKRFDQCILPVLTYGSNTWVLTKDIIHKLQGPRGIRKEIGGSYSQRPQYKCVARTGKLHTRCH